MKDKTQKNPKILNIKKIFEITFQALENPGSLETLFFEITFQALEKPGSLETLFVEITFQAFRKTLESRNSLSIPISRSYALENVAKGLPLVPKNPSPSESLPEYQKIELELK